LGNNPDSSANSLLDQKLSEYHIGYRAFAREVLETLPNIKTVADA
jgi:hypothetical protein